MTPAFLRALLRTLQWEGYESDDPHDPGGFTRYGISQRAHPGVDVRALTLDGAAEIYWHDYWDELQLDDLTPGAAAAMFDAAVNLGPQQATRLAQRAVNALGGGLVVDGRWGPATAAGVRAQGDRFAIALAGVRAAHYVGLAERHPRFRRYLVGWLRRSFDLP